LSDTLVDASAWIDFFRGIPAAVSRIDPLLADGRVSLAGPVYAELLSGVRSQAEFELLGTLLRSLEWIAEPLDVWDQVARARFLLARQGHQAATMDVVIAVDAVSRGQALLTRDRDFLPIARVLPLKVDFF
jgi:predicted nucleic acid-binding protein